MNLDIWLAGTLILRGSYTQINFSGSGKTPFFVIDPFRTFCILFFLRLGFERAVLFESVTFLI